MRSCTEGDFGAVSGVRPIEQLCSHFVTIAEVGKRRAVWATTGEYPVTTARI
jgi:hypothetical protein